MVKVEKSPGAGKVLESEEEIAVGTLLHFVSELNNLAHRLIFP